MLISQIPYNYNNISKLNNRNVERNQMISFTAKPPIIREESKFFKSVKEFFKPEINYYNEKIDQLARGLGRIIDTKAAYKILEKTKNLNLFNHLMTAGSVVMSGLYITRTLSNKDLDEKKRKTLAINQFIVFAISTLMCYTVEGAMKSKVAEFVNKFEAVNFKSKQFLKNLQPNETLESKLKKCSKGIDVASKIMIFDMIYRFIAPVLVTPLANHIGNKINEKQEAELVKS